jgi:TnpA family transposase
VFDDVRDGALAQPPFAADQESADGAAHRTLLGRWAGIAPFIAGAIDEKLITAHRDEVLRLAASVRTGTVSASQMLKRLGAFPRQNGLLQALHETGRIERTLFTLDWLENP